MYHNRLVREDINSVNILWQKSQQALVQLLTNIQGSLGPDYQHKITSRLIQSHRV